VLWNAISPVKAAEYKEAQGVAASLGLELLSTEVRGPDDFEGAFQAVASSRVDGPADRQDPPDVLSAKLDAQSFQAEAVKLGTPALAGLDR
jgi:hypothetical protein